jgi:hypothetical protein
MVAADCPVTDSFRALTVPFPDNLNDFGKIVKGILKCILYICPSSKG